jgi:hypothetical protein
MQFIRLPKAIDIAKRILPELVLDWINTNCVQIIDIKLIQKLRLNMFISCIINWSEREMPHQRTYRNFINGASAI